jgi:hypothetical protein
MKKKTIFFTALLTCIISSVSFGQEKSSATKYIPSIGAHFGALSYLGDIKGTEGATVFTYWKPAYGFYLEKKFGNIFGVSVNGMFGKVSKSQLDDNVFLNFETSITNFDLNLLLDFDNGKIINKKSLFAPFISIGFGHLSFDPKGDLFKNGNAYNHWTDGTLRDMSQTTPGADTLSSILTRDYEYESELKDSLKDYSKSSFTIPIRLGFKFEISKHIDARISAAYILTMTDYLDNVAVGGNDKLFYTSFGLQYNFVSGDDDEDKYKDFDFSDLDKEDADGDGVIDSKDFCQNTPKDIAVDNKGCALDGDKDGVPDYQDKEANTPAGTLVNAEGVTLTDEMIATQDRMKDSIEVQVTVFKAEDLSKEELAEIQRVYEESNDGQQIPQVAIPAKFKGLDLDNDKYISAKEVTNAIDQFFEGENDLSAKDLHDLIDYYFDQ